MTPSRLANKHHQSICLVLITALPISGKHLPNKISNQSCNAHWNRLQNIQEQSPTLSDEEYNEDGEAPLKEIQKKL